MEPTRRTITTQKSQKKRENTKKVLMITGIVLGLALIFFVSFKISYGLMSDDTAKKADTAASSSTEEDIANMSREDLEANYIKLKKQLEEKDAEIKMLKERLGEHEEPSETPAPSATTAPTEESDDDDDEPDPTPKPTAPPAATPAPQQTPPSATNAPSGELMSPDELANLSQTN